MGHQLFAGEEIQSGYQFFMQNIICISCAIVSALAVSPIVSIVDKSVIQSANNKEPLSTVLMREMKKTIIGSPKFWMNVEFQWVFTVYLLTYATSNLSGLLLKSNEWIDPLVGKLLFTFVVNSSASMVKDKAMAERLGKGKKRQFPKASLGLFFLRDILAMSSAFTLPYFLSPHLQNLTDLQPNIALYFCQLISPAMTQIFTTFIQLLALDIFNRENKDIMNRLRQVKKSYLNSLIVRIIGFTIAYGIGGVVNIETKRNLEEML